MISELYRSFTAALGDQEDGGDEDRPHVNGSGGRLDAGDDARGSHGTTDDGPTTGSDVAVPFDVRTLLDAMNAPAFVLDDEHTVIAWNHGMEVMNGLTKAEVLGSDDYVGRNEAGDRVKTLANKVLEYPETAHEEYDVERIDPEYVEVVTYRNETTIENVHGERRHVRFTATPIYRDGELVAVIEVFEDRTDIVERQRATEALVEEVTDTLAALSRGDLSARADRTDDHHLVEGHLLDIFDRVNETASDLESLVEEVERATRNLSSSVQATATNAEDIAGLVENQNESLGEVAEEVNAFSATMEEVAANSDEVATAARDVREAAEEGYEASQRARESTAELTEDNDQVIAAIEQLEGRMDEVDEIVEFISDVAEQTNILALNANIEAARAGEAGEGFGVVAEEVKSLAEETKNAADEIDQLIADFKAQTDEVAEAVEDASESVDESVAEIEDTLEALESVTSSVEEVSGSIDEVATANDDQAATAEEIAVTVDQVREYAADVRTATEAIAEGTREQATAVDQLAARVEAMSEGGTETGAGKGRVRED